MNDAPFIELKFDLTLKNLEPFFKSDAATAELDKVTQLSALLVQGIIVKKISQHGTGNWYIRRGIAHQASSPYEPPATDTGILKSNIAIDQKFLLAHVIANTNYADFLEDGTDNMSPRPFMKPSFDEALPKINTMFEDALARVLDL